MYSIYFDIIFVSENYSNNFLYIFSFTSDFSNFFADSEKELSVFLVFKSIMFV